jgi:hypothetical protein
VLTRLDLDIRALLTAALAVLALAAAADARPAAAPPYTLSGRVTDGFGHGVGGAKVTLGGAQSGTTTADEGGNYSFPNLQAGNYLLTASLPGRQDTLTFTVEVNNLNADTVRELQIRFFVTFQVSAKDASGAGIAGVGIRVNSETFVFAQTNSFGLANINVGVPVTGDGPPVTFVPEKPGFTFNPTSLTVSTQGGGQAVNFTGAPTGLPVSFIQFSSSFYGVGEGDGSVTLTATRTGDTSTAVTARYSTADGSANQKTDYIMAAGTLKFAPGETAKTIRVLVIDDAFTQGSQTFSVQLSNPTGGASLGDLRVAGVNVVDNDAGQTTANPLDGTTFFVREQYYDFLNRLPDAAGLSFWSGELTSCGTDAQCLEVKRINVSAAFFLSIEFQETGFLVERVYKAAYGDAKGSSTLGGPHTLSVPIIRLGEFLPDTQEIGRGVIVHQGDWRQQLEANKTAFLDEFVRRPRFTSAFPAAMTAAQFVDALDANAGGPLTRAERNRLVEDLQTGARTRAGVLRAVAENQSFSSAEFDRAFVLMQYFGYLRRNPDDPPDADYTGYDFWLGKLKEFDGDYIRAEMVKAFISSDEYRKRFGQ